MQLPRDGAENIHLTLTATPTDATIEGSLDDRATWFPIPARDPDGQPVFLAAGPDYTGPAAGPHRLTATATALWVRAIADPETVVRYAGTIDLI